MKDAKSNLHQFSFDARNAVGGATNPQAKAETYLYDEAHNLKQTTDRKNQISKYTYDNLNRLATVTFVADGSSITYSYDQGNRVKKIVDTLKGTIDYTYDDFDRVASETTARGTVGYTYYANGLRKTMTVSGMPALTYTYDPGNRLTAIDQSAGAANNNVAERIAFAYDAANRRTRTTLANGVTVDYGYDDANQLASITYRKADASVIGDLTYAYDANGQRTAVGGTLARTALPAAVATSTVDAANRLTGLNGRTLTYDDNGNLTGDGSQVYVWNARDQLSQIKSPTGTVLASFSYDALGRRQAKTVGGVGTGYVYDGANIVQELNGPALNNSVPANVRASYISGGIDEVFAQLSGTGAGAKVVSYLRDALGSTVRLTDGAGNKLVDYTYDPYGVTTADAAPNNPFQYTGRENDGNGLYYYRARYYSPGMARFISSDPIGLGGGINTFGYVGGNPISKIDPGGLSPISLGEGWSGRIDSVPGTEIWEIHVFDKSGAEVGMFNEKGWFNKHGHKGAPDGVPQCVNDQLKGNALAQMRKRGHAPAKGKANIKGVNWKKFGRVLGPLGTVIVIGVGVANDQSPAEIGTDMICNAMWGCGGE